jgi:hypothetical protein
MKHALAKIWREVEAGNEWIVDAETAVQAMGGGCVDMAGGDRRSASSVATTDDASGPKGIVGPSKTALKPPRINSGSITTRRACGMVGIGTSHW